MINKALPEVNTVKKMTTFELHISVENTELSTLQLLAQECALSGNKLSNSELKQAIQKGALWLTCGQSTHRFRRIKKTLNLNNTLHFYYNQQVLQQKPPEAQLIADHKTYSVWYKPYGMLSQGSKWSDHCTIARYVQQYFKSERSCFIVHRLDRAASGLIVIAHTKKAAQAFSALFETHDLEKTYHIIVQGEFKQAPDPIKITSEVGGKSALSFFSLIEYNQTKNLSLVKVKIATGRKHQIRIHAASIGLPVLGDRLHGKAKKEEVNLQLCAVKLAFTCPLNHEVREYNLPEKHSPSLANIE